MFRKGSCPIHGYVRFVWKEYGMMHYRDLIKKNGLVIQVFDENDERNFECYKCRIERHGGWKKFAFRRF